MKLYSIVFKGKVVNICPEQYDEAYLTKSGTIPIVAVLTVKAITEDCIVLAGGGFTPVVGDKYCIDFEKPYKYHEYRNNSLFNILSGTNVSMFSNYVIGRSRPLVRGRSTNIDTTGLDVYQANALRMIVNSENYCLVNAPMGSGRMKLLMKLLRIWNTEPVLVVTSSHNQLLRIAKRMKANDLQFIICSNEIDEIPNAMLSNSMNHIIRNARTITELNSNINNRNVFIMTAKHSATDPSSSRSFKHVIIYDASMIDIVDSIPSLNEAPFVMFGDYYLDNSIDSAYKRLFIAHQEAVISLENLRNVAREIVMLRSLLSGDRMKTNSRKSTVNTKPLSILLSKELMDTVGNGIAAQNTISRIKRCDPTAVFITAVICGMVFPSVDLVAPYETFVQLRTMKLQALASPELFFTVEHQFMCDSLNRITLLTPAQVRETHHDRLIWVADTSETLKSVLFTARKSILIMGSIYNSPLFDIVSPRAQLIPFPENASEPFLFVREPWLDLSSDG